VLPVHTILHPTDFSDPSRYAFDLAQELAWDQGARLVVLHVIPRSEDHTGLSPPQPPAELVERSWTELVKIRPRDPRVLVEHRLKIGNPVAEILATVRETKAGMIVMGIHGRKGLRRMLLGSVAEAVSRAAPCCVLTVKSPSKPASGKRIRPNFIGLTSRM
jgi:nucleotide-binding universal stress UspA family protein